MFLIGRFDRGYFTMSENKNPLMGAGIVYEITKKHLQSAKTDNDYQVIDLKSLKYFDPEQNAWVDLQRFDND